MVFARRSRYFSELCRAMEAVAEHPRSIFLGQSVSSPGTGMTASFAKVPRDKLLELPVAEDMQLGMSIGLALSGDLPVSVFPRWNFLLLATNQIVNHLDKLPLYSDYRPRVIIRTASATPVPLDPGPQHLGDFTWAFRSLLKTVSIVQLEHASDVVPAYRGAINNNGSTILVEYPELY